LAAKRHNTTIANISGRWVLDKPSVSGIIVGARNAKHVEDHQRMMELVLDDNDLMRIEAVLASGRQARGDVYSWERGGLW
jgi:aryl-alcohol dehydrogenase-like predicted oxidoreductase